MYPVESGTVTKLGYPYGDDLAFRYVELETVDGFFYRYFYVEPLVDLGHYVVGIKDLSYNLSSNDALGIVQDLTARYPGITNHFHFEIKNPSGMFVDPTEFLT